MHNSSITVPYELHSRRILYSASCNSCCPCTCFLSEYRYAQLEA